MKPSSKAQLDSLYIRYPKLLACEETLFDMTEAIICAYQKGGKLLVTGNGGSAADALHIVGELMKGFLLPRNLSEVQQMAFAGLPDGNLLVSNLQGALPAVSLANEVSLSTAYSNDKVPELVFAQQVYGLCRSGDVFLGISTSGNSRNILLAAQTARAVGACVLGLSGGTGGRLKAMCDICIVVPERETYLIQELHMMVYHAICLALENEFFGGD